MRSPEIPEQKVDTFGDTTQALDEMYSLYGTCRIKHNGLIDYLEKVH